ncbi:MULTISPECIES: tail fiber protein [Pseudomonas]|jgi:microcystin-dependent protein|nr:MULTISPECIES: phage tail protein [Pseudomonas]MBY8932010.1 tail fiber protein [Pseudomonas sp. Wu6]CRM04827.1 Phage Tail Collar Domain protein [Pseudomonas sp. 24 E 13]CRM59095.1 Phage Tail Collar Domain protein [Pseudomonas sp. 44 R 15]CRM98619.1 Phage Tail Collar Domain protein [Pseudomonas sp. 34 E 7]
MSRRHGAWPMGLVSDGSLPVGAVTAFAGAVGTPVPNTAKPADVTADSSLLPIEAWGWMLCDGRELEVSVYEELHAMLGYLYGGSGATFHIPDYRGTFLRGNDCGALKDPDTAIRTDPTGSAKVKAGIGSRQTAAMLTHEHTYQTVPVAVQIVEAGSADSATPGQSVTSAPTDAQGNVLSAGVSQFETRPSNIAVNYLIKFTSGAGSPWAQLWL